uniref:Ribosome production factor 1 n=1 Tax=Sinocyclocheilus grahami TaxID=75366 RepID=A0A672MU60_SINGR
LKFVISNVNARYARSWKRRGMTHSFFPGAQATERFGKKEKAAHLSLSENCRSLLIWLFCFLYWCFNIFSLFQAPPKEVPKTIENQRIYDETTVNPEDEEVAFDEGTDEFSAYFSRLTNPKVLITTSDRPRGRTVRFCEQLATVIPHAHVYYRRGLALKRVIPQCVSRGFTYVMVINEDRKVPNGLVLCHLPDGPTAHFKVSNVRLRKEMKRRGKEPTEHIPEVILNNFSTRLGHSIGRLFAALFPHDPQFVGRQVATFHNQRDFIFFRFHRYIFKNEKKVGIQELGPRFTLKLRSLQKGTFDCMVPVVIKCFHLQITVDS